MIAPWGGRLLHGVAVTLVVAALTHLTAVLLIPGRTAADATASLAAQPRGPEWPSGPDGGGCEHRSGPSPHRGRG